MRLRENGAGMSGDDTYEFYIDAFTPASIPMSRLAEYMAEDDAL
jgi:hypothetical protein